MINSKTSLAMAMAGLIGLTSISIMHAFDRVNDFLNHRFCTSSSCNNLTPEAQHDRNIIEQNAHDAINNSFFAWIGLATEQDFADREIQRYVSHTAYDYARTLGASYYEANKISETIGGMVGREQQKNTPGNCNQFIGAGLKYRTEKLLQELRKKHTQPQLAQNNPVQTIEYRPKGDLSSDSDPCPVCLTEGIPKKDRVICPKEHATLSNYSDTVKLYDTCKHFLCIGCAQRWFFDENKNSCPLCRGRVDKTILASIIAFKNNVKTQEALMPHNGYNPAPEGAPHQPGAAYPQPSAPPYYD